jgi:hypothetical protein
MVLMICQQGVMPVPPAIKLMRLRTHNTHVHIQHTEHLHASVISP